MTTSSTITIDPERVALIESFHLARGNHASIEEGACVMEMVAYVAGEPHSDHPACADPVLTAYATRINDQMPDAERQRLIPYIPRLVGTAAGPAAAQRRAYVAADWAVRVFAPSSLDHAGFTDQATVLRSLPPITDQSSAAAAATTATATAAKAAATAAAKAAAATATATAAAATATKADSVDSAYSAYSAYSAAKATATAEDWHDALACLDAMIDAEERYCDDHA